MKPPDVDHCDLLIIGAGPAGIAAAVAAAPSGAAIVMVDDNPAPGGQIWRDGPAAHLPPVARDLRDAVARCANVRLCTSTRVVAVTAPGQLLLENAARGWRVQWKTLILCTGARELLLPFPGWTLPGVTGAGALQALIKGGVPVEGERIVIAGSGPLLMAAAASASKAGGRVVHIAEQASLAAVAAFAMRLMRWPGKAVQALTLANRHYRTSARVVSALGQHRVEAVRIRQGVVETQFACDRIACGFGLVPNTQLGQALGCSISPASIGPQALVVDAEQETSIPGIYAAGECTGFGGSERALVQGRMAGYAAVGDSKAAQAHEGERVRWNSFAAQLHRSFALDPVLKQLPAPDTLVCRCEDVSYAAVARCSGWTDAKLHSRCGMGACQGRVCGAATQFLFGWTPPSPRSPLSPARIATLAGMAQPQSD